MGCVLNKNKRILPQGSSISRSTVLDDNHESRKVVLFIVKEEQSCMEQSVVSKRQSVVHNSAKVSEKFFFTENEDIDGMHVEYLDYN